MEVSVSSLVLPEVEVEKSIEVDGDTLIQDPVVSPNKTVVVAPIITSEEKESSGPTPNMEKENGSQGATKEDQKSAGEEMELNSGNYTEDVDLLDLLAGPSERVKIGALSRRRKHVNVFVFAAPQERPPIVVEKGDGCRLEEIPSIEAQINKRPYSDLIRLHRLVFGKPGTHEEIKTSLKLFSGFPFGVASEEYQKKKDALLTMNEIVRDVLCDCLAMDKSGEKECVVENIMQFLMKPTGAVPKPPGAEDGDAKAAIENDKGKATDAVESDSTVAASEEEGEQESEESNVSVATPEKKATKRATAASKPRKSKPKKDKENKPLKDQDQDQQKPAQRKRKGFNAPITDKLKPPKKFKSKPKSTDKSDKSVPVASIE